MIRRLLLGGLAALMLASTEARAGPVTIVAEDGQTPIGGALTPVGCSQITSLSAATVLTVPSGATAAVLIPEAQAVRYRDDGTAPTASVGQPLAVAQPLIAYGVGELQSLQFIQQVASATLNVCFYR